MSNAIKPYPYAAKAYVQHEFDVDHLNIWLTFRHPMDQTVKPDHELWICEVDAAPKAITASAWLSEFTMLLTVDDVGAFPDRVLISYDGPDDNLRTTWQKQWEPWTEILSLSVPYGWEGVIFIDIPNKRVGIAGPPTTRTFEIVSPDGTQRIMIYHDDFSARLRWSAGSLYLVTDEGVNTVTSVRIQGKGTGYARFFVYDQDNTGYAYFTAFHGAGHLRVDGVSPTFLHLQNNPLTPITMFVSCTEGETQKYRLYGWKAGDAAQRHVDLQISPNADNTALWSGVLNYVFEGSLRVSGDFKSLKSRITFRGGLAAELTNKTGAPSVTGDIVIASTVTADAIALAGANELMAVGAFLDSGIADGSEAWIVWGGICNIHMDAGGCAIGDRIVTSLTPGRGAVNNAPSVAIHFQEVGHALQVAGPNGYARIMMHHL